MKTINVKLVTLGIVLAILSTLSLAQAPEAHPLPRHPGDVIKYDIKFAGPNAEKIKSVNAALNLQTSMPKDQAGFNAGFGATSFQPSAPDTFHVELTVPDNIASGDYTLFFGARAAEGSANYSNGTDFQVPIVHIENPKTFTPPSVTVKPLP
jgi:hypothetical protein